MSAAVPSSLQLLELAREAADEAAELVLGLRHQGVEVAATKSSAVDIVTPADRASETLIRDRVLAARPDDGFLGEEGDRRQGTSGVEWVVDPIDGTVNYFYGIPAYAVSIAARIEGQVVAGVVANPATSEVFMAALGDGARLGEQTLRLGDEPLPAAQMLIGTGFNYDPALRARQGAAVGRLLAEVRDVRRIGSCALDLCYVAAGRLDAYVELGVNAWDYAAGALIAREAGAMVAVTTVTSPGPSPVTSPGPDARTRILAAGRANFDAVSSLAHSVGL